MFFFKADLAVSAEEAPGKLSEYPLGLLGPFSLFSMSLHKDHRDKCTRWPKVVRSTVVASVGGRRAWPLGGSTLRNQIELSFALF